MEVSVGYGDHRTVSPTQGDISRCRQAEEFPEGRKRQSVVPLVELRLPSSASSVVGIRLVAGNCTVMHRTES